MKHIVNPVILFVALAGMICLSQRAEAQRIYGTPYLQTYNAPGQIISNQVWDVIQDDEGLMYFAGKNGVITYDGDQWNTIYLSNFQTARSIDKAHDGAIYVGGMREVGYLAADSLGGLEYISLVEKVPKELRPFMGDMRRTIATSQAVFFLSNYMLLRYKDGVMTGYGHDHKEGLTFNKVYKHDDKIYALRPKAGFYVFENDSLQMVKGGEAAKDENSTTSGFISWGEGEQLLVKYTGDALIFGREGARDATGPVFDQLKKIMAEAFVSEITPIKGLGYALNTEDVGLIFTDNAFNVLYHLKKENGLADNAARFGLVDQAGNYWTVTNKGVSYIILNSPFTKANEKDGLDAGVLSAVMKNDTLFLGSTWGVKYVAGSEFVQIPGSQLQVWDIDVIDDQIFASVGNYLQRMDVNGITDQSVRAEPWGLVPVRGKEGSYLLHTYRHFLKHIRIENGDVKSSVDIPGYSGDARVVLQDKSGYFWFSNGNDTLKRGRLNDEMDTVMELQSFDESHGLPSVLANDIIQFDDAGEQGILVINGPDYYEYNARKDTFTRYEPLQDLRDNSKFRLLKQTDDGTIYTMATRDKYRLLNKGDHYVVDTLGFAKINELNVQSIFVTPDNTILYLSPEGMHQYNPARAPQRQTQFNTRISKVTVTTTGDILTNGVSLSDSYKDKEGALIYKDNSIGFAYSGLFYEEPEQTRYQYRLEGYEEEWSSWVPTTFKEYTNLKEGSYTFHVKAKSLYGVEGNEASFSFRIHPPWYRSSLAFGGYGLIIVVLVWIIVRGYNYKLIREKERLEALVVLRTREISQQKDEIASQAQALQESNEKLRELDRFKQDMTAMIAHDLKNPLTVILKRGEKKISGLAQKMLNLVLNMLDVQKFEDTDMHLSLTESSLNVLINKALNQVEDAIRENHLKIEIEAPVSYHAVMDEGLIERVLVNLLTNALKHAPVNSTILLKVTRDEEGQLKFSITDEGPGIAKDRQSAVFHRYVQGDRSADQHAGSTGLGLAFCKLVIEAHNGQIGVDSEPGKGASFWFILPESVESEQAIPITINEAASEVSASELEALRALIPELRKLKAYQSTEIENLLAQLEAKEGRGLYEICQKLISISYHGDKEAYEQLLDELELH